MTGWLLDTNVVSELRRPKPEPKVIAFVRAQPLEALHISIVTLAEIRLGIELLPDATAPARLNDWLGQQPTDVRAARGPDLRRRHAQVAPSGRSGPPAGHTFSQPDLIIAATAQHHGLTVVSRDIKEYVTAQVDIFNPWTDALPTA